MRPRRREIEAEQRVLNEPLYQALRDPVLEFIDRLQRAATVDDWVYLHRDLLIEFGARQDAADQTLPEAKARVTKEIRELAQREPRSMDQVHEKQRVLDRIKMQELVARASQHTLRQIADGISWKALHYDRGAFTILGEGERVGRLASGVGREAELHELGRLFEEEGLFAIHNDLTNCLRHGDLTIIRPRDGGLEVTLAEVKAGPRPDNTPQLARLERATALLREGRRITDEGSLQVTAVPASYETYLYVLPGLIAEAREVGFAWTRPHEALLLGAVDYRVWGRDADAYSARSDALRREIGWGAEEPETFGWTASLRRMRDRSRSLSSLAPYTIFPLPPQDVADLVMGFVDLAVGLHVPLLEQAVATDEMAVRVARPPDSADLFLEATRRGSGLRAPAHLREQMMIELMKPDCLRTALDHVLALNEQHRGQELGSRIVVFADESQVWENARRKRSTG